MQAKKSQHRKTKKELRYLDLVIQRQLIELKI